ncbi:hypothetical protein QM042_01650 [Escherichia coli]|uniref:FimD/PapC N-terminal domain-containing protein n=1 Tax=Escherichia coli TaxID=562 RepID=UPI0039877B3E
MSKFNSTGAAMSYDQTTSQLLFKIWTFISYTCFNMSGLVAQHDSTNHPGLHMPMPGGYFVGVYLNNQWRCLFVVSLGDDPNATCLSMEQLKQIGILTEGISIDKGVHYVSHRYTVKGGSVDYDIGHFNL